MRFVIVGYGVQGKKRHRIAGPECAGVVDPVAAEADFRDIRAVPLGSYDGALVCTPDEPKMTLLTYLLGNGKHVLVEKPLHAEREEHLVELEHIARAQGAVCYTAYNHRFENRAPDHVVIGSETSMPRLEFEMTLLAWRNHFTCDVLAENGTAHIESLCKWGPTTFTHRTRVLPSGRPPEQATTLVGEDPTWALEYEHFKRLIADQAAPDLGNDRWLLRVLGRLSREAVKTGEAP